MWSLSSHQYHHPLDGCPSQKPRHPLTPPQCSGGHCNSPIPLRSFCLPLGIQVSYLTNHMSLFLGPPPSSSLVSLQSILYSAIRVTFLVILLSCLILQRLPAAHRIKAKSPSAGFSPVPCSLCSNLPFPTPCSHPLRRAAASLHTRQPAPSHPG